eukprot:Skav236673  [mRNA]  locus=scaffold338:400738:405778:- [translate_table: standard]
MGAENGLYHICEGEASKCKLRKNRGDRRELIHVDKWRLLTPMSMLNISYLSQLGVREGERALAEKTRELKEPLAPPAAVEDLTKEARAVDEEGFGRDGSLSGQSVGGRSGQSNLERPTGGSVSEPDYLRESPSEGDGPEDGARTPNVGHEPRSPDIRSPCRNQRLVNPTLQSLRSLVTGQRMDDGEALGVDPTSGLRTGRGRGEGVRQSTRDEGRETPGGHAQGDKVEVGSRQRAVSKPREAREPSSSVGTSRSEGRRRRKRGPSPGGRRSDSPTGEFRRGHDPEAPSRGSAKKSRTEAGSPRRKGDHTKGRGNKGKQSSKGKEMELLEGEERKGGRQVKGKGKRKGAKLAEPQEPPRSAKRSPAEVSSRKITELMSWLSENEPKHLSAAQMGVHLVLQAVTLNGTLGQLIEMSLAPTQVEGRTRNLFPLPLWPDVRTELETIIDKMKFKDQPGEWRERGDTKSAANRALRKQGLLVWHGLVVIALNWLHSDGKPTNAVGPPGGYASKAQEAALERIWQMAKIFVNEKPEQKGGVPRTPEAPWKGELSKLRVSYTGEVVEKAQPLTLEQILPGLPSPDHGGLVNILEVVDERLARKLKRPDLMLRENIAELVPEPQVMCGDIEWAKVAKALYDRHLVTPVDQFPVIDEKPVLNGAFGVVKPEKFTEAGEPVLRMIVDLRASNTILEQLEGDVHTLTGSCAFQKLVVDYEDDLLISGDDLTAAFYLFKLPPSWPQFLVLRKPVPWEVFEPGKPGNTFIGLTVLPMGWNSAVAVMQNAHRQLALRSEQLLGAGLLEKAEVRRDAVFPDIDEGPIWQVYLDDTTIIEKIDRSVTAALEGKPPEVQQRLRKAYAWWGIPTNAAKALERVRKAERLGAVLDGERGVLRGSTKRGLELMSLGAHLRAEGAFNKKGLQIYAGKAVHLLQFRRPLFSVLQEVFVEIVRAQEMLELRPSTADEMLVLEALLPTMMSNLKAPIDPVITASDACETGGGACFASRLSRVGEEELLKQMEEPLNEEALVSLDFRAGAEKIVAVDLFAGIGGLERALHLAGVQPCYSVAVDKDADCRRCLRRNFPGMEFWSDITTVTKEKVKSWLKKVPDATGVVTGMMGSPCQGLSTLSVDRQHLEDPRSKLFYAGAEVIKMIKEVAEEEGLWSLNLVENVVPDEQDIREMSRVLGDSPIMVDAGLLSRVRRPRLYWVDVDLMDMEEIEAYPTEEFRVLQYGSGFEDDEVFLEPGHRWEGGADANVRFPTFTRSIPRKAPPKSPAGIRNTPPDAEERWRAHDYRYPPYTYRKEFMIQTEDSLLQPLQARERERLMGFLPDHTLGMAKKMPETPEERQALEDQRCAAIGNSFHTVAVASILDDPMWSLGVKDLRGHHLIREKCTNELKEANQRMQSEPTSIEEVAEEEGSAALKEEEEGYGSDTTSIQVEKMEGLDMQPPKVQPGPGPGMAAMEAQRSAQLIAAYVRRQEYRGSDVRLDTGTLYRPDAFPRATINPHKWEWHIAHSYPFRTSEHINILELRALNHTMEWRLRRSTFGSCRAMHLSDSQVVLGVVVKGRSSSRQLNRLLRRLAALLVAGGVALVVAWVETHLNPADAPSREHEPQASRGA